jgi:hypothetical protein
MENRKMLSTLAVGTLTTGVSLVERFAGVGEAAEWIMGRPVWTHELPGARPEIVRLILDQHPDMPTEVDPGDDGWRLTRQDLLDRYGEQIEVAEGASERTEDPLTSLVRMVAGKDTPNAE